MNIIDSIKELKDSVGVALSLKTLRRQWKDMIGMFAPRRAEEQPVAPESKHTVLKMRIGYGKWPHGKGTVVTAKRPNFTFGNADIFDVCLDPGNEQVGDVWCSVFFDETLGGYVLMQATGTFNVRVTGDSEPYRPGDWSLFPNGLSYQTFPQSNVLVPLSDKKLPDRVLFSIGNAYFFEAWAYALTEDEDDEQYTPAEVFTEHEEMQDESQQSAEKYEQESVPREPIVGAPVEEEDSTLQSAWEEPYSEETQQDEIIPVFPVQEESIPASPVVSEVVPIQPEPQPVIPEPVFVPEPQPVIPEPVFVPEPQPVIPEPVFVPEPQPVIPEPVFIPEPTPSIREPERIEPLAPVASDEVPVVLNPFEMSAAREEPTVVVCREEERTVIFDPKAYYYNDYQKPSEQEDAT